MNCLPHILALALHSQAGFEAVVPGAGVLCRAGEDGQYMAGAGAYHNSEKAVARKISQYAFAGWQPLHWGPVRLGAVAGGVNGYSYNSGRTLPMAAAVVSVPSTVLPEWTVFEPVKRVVDEFHVLVIPPVRGVTPAVAQLSFTVRF